MTELTLEAYISLVNPFLSKGQLKVVKTLDKTSVTVEGKLNAKNLGIVASQLSALFPMESPPLYFEMPPQHFPYETLFDREEVWNCSDWPLTFRSWLNKQSKTYPTKIIKINNLRWLFDEHDLRRFLIVFPQVEKVEFVGALMGQLDDHEEDRYFCSSKPILATYQVSNILGHRANSVS